MTISAPPLVHRLSPQDDALLGSLSLKASMQDEHRWMSPQCKYVVEQADGATNPGRTWSLAGRLAWHYVRQQTPSSLALLDRCLSPEQVGVWEPGKLAQDQDALWLLFERLRDGRTMQSRPLKPKVSVYTLLGRMFPASLSDAEKERRFGELGEGFVHLIQRVMNDPVQGSSHRSVMLDWLGMVQDVTELYLSPNAHSNLPVRRLREGVMTLDLSKPAAVRQAWVRAFTASAPQVWEHVIRSPWDLASVKLIERESFFLAQCDVETNPHLARDPARRALWESWVTHALEMPLPTKTTYGQYIGALALRALVWNPTDEERHRLYAIVQPHGEEAVSRLDLLPGMRESMRVFSLENAFAPQPMAARPRF